MGPPTTAPSGASTVTAPPLAAATPIRRFGDALIIVAPAWLVSRGLVIATLVLARLTVARVRPHNLLAAARTHQGLLAWDGGWYESIATHGYGLSSRQSLRFFPAFPIAGRVVGWLVGGPGPGLIVVSNLCALFGMATLLLLIQRDMGDVSLARRSVWLLALAPSAFTLTMGYAEGMLLLCATVAMLAARTHRWWWAAAAGLVAGATRPLGLLLAIPILVEVYGSRRQVMGADVPDKRRRAVAQGAALVAPVVGFGTYLLWVQGVFGNGWLPLSLQDQSGHRGSITLPFAAMAHNLVSALHGHHLGSAMHIPWVLVSAALLVVAFRRLPLSYGAFAAGVLLVSVASSNLDSFERYALSAFPLVIAGSTLTSRVGVERTVLVLSGLAMIGYAFLAFVGIAVP